MAAKRILPGSLVRTEAGAAAITLFVRDGKADKYYALSDRYVIEGGRSVRGESVGAAISLSTAISATQVAERDISNKLAFFELVPDVELENLSTVLDSAVNGAASVAEFLAPEALVLGADGKGFAIKLTGFDVPIELSDGDEVVAYTDAIIGVVPGISNEVLNEFIYSGAPVVNTKTKNVIGAIVGAMSDGWVIAPIHDVLKKNGFEVLVGKRVALPTSNIVSFNARVAKATPKTAETPIRSPQPNIAAGGGRREAQQYVSRDGSVRIAGVNIPTSKRVIIALQYIHGIGPKNAEEIVKKVGVEDSRRTNQLTDAEILQIRETIDRDYTVEGDLRREVAMNIKRLMDLACYRGMRHRKGLPVRGQRTHTNARTRKGKAVPIAGKKK